MLHILLSILCFSSKDSLGNNFFKVMILDLKQLGCSPKRASYNHKTFAHKTFPVILSCVFTSAFKKQMEVCVLSHVQHFATPWTVAHQVPLSIGFPRQEYWSGLPFPPPGHLPAPGIKPASPALAGGFFTTEPPRKPSRS